MIITMALVSPTPTNRELSPTEKKIAQLKAEYQAKTAELRSTGIKADLISGVKKNPNLSDDELYTLCKPFTNMHERKLAKEREARGETPQKRGRKPKEVAQTQ